MKTIIQIIGWISGYLPIKKGVFTISKAFEWLAELPDEELAAIQRTVQELASTPMYVGEEWMMSFRASEEGFSGETQPLIFFIHASIGMALVTTGVALVCAWAILIHVLLR